MVNIKKIFNTLRNENNSNIQTLLDELDINRSSYNTSVRNNSLNTSALSKIVDFCAKKNIDLNYVFLDEEIVKKTNIAQKINLIQRELTQLKKEISV